MPMKFPGVLGDCGALAFFFEEIMTTVLKKVENNEVTIQPDLKIRGRSKPQHINL